MKDKLLAKRSMLKNLKHEMMDLMGDDRGDLKDILGKKLMKVTVAAKDEKGLKKGLSKAEEILAKKGLVSDDESEESEEQGKYECEDCGDMGCPACDAMAEMAEDEESSESEESDEDESPESLKAQILELKKKLAEKSE